MKSRQTLPRQTLPRLWLLSDARNDAVLECALRRLPRGSGFVFRHYHLPPPERKRRFDRLARIARTRGHAVFLAGPARQARAWRADGTYGQRAPAPLMWLATVHGLREIGRANRHGADAALLSPVFPTRSHPGAAVLGPLRFRLLARQARCPVIALGGMNRQTARRLGWPRWAAIDGLAADGLCKHP